MNDIPTDPQFIRYTALSLSGPLIWSAHFGAAYGIQHVICSIAPSFVPFVPFMVIAATLAAIALTAAGVWLTARMESYDETSSEKTIQFYKYTTYGLSALSLFGIAVTCLAGLMFPPCADLR